MWCDELKTGHLTRVDNSLTNKPLSARACVSACVALRLMIVICRKCSVPLNACNPDEVNDIIFCHLATHQTVRGSGESSEH